MKRHLLLPLALFGCALLGKNTPVVPRYFTPEYAGQGAQPRVQPELRLRLGRITAWAHLRERLVVRSSPQELVYEEDLRWTERPEVYLKAALERRLFEERGIVEAIAGSAPTLEVELTAFEELRQPADRVRLQALLTLHDDRSMFAQTTVIVEEPVAAGGGTELALAFSRALHRGVDQIADLAIARLRAPDLKAEE